MRANAYAVKGDRTAENASVANDYYDRAMADYKKAYFCGYDDEAGIRLGMGETARKLGQQADALDALSRAMELLDGKELAKARLSRGRLYQDMEQNGDAKDDLKAAVALDETNIPLVFEYATLLAV